MPCSGRVDKDMIYLNHAATTYPKPQCVTEAHAAAFSAPPSGQFRSSGQGGGKDVFTSCRENLARLLGIGSPEQIYFTSGATDSLNQLFYGLERKGKRILATQTEHNSVLRPLYNGIAGDAEVEIVPCDRYGRVSPEEFEERIRPDVGLFVLNHCSNVTGMIQDAARFGEIAERHGILFLMDASQSAGCIPIDCDAWHVDALVFTGHKGLFGPQGTGGFYLREGVGLRPYRYGGTGKDSSRLVYENGEYEYETGTQNGHGIPALNAGVEYLLGHGVERIAEEEQRLMGLLYDGLSEIRGVTVYGEKGQNLGPVLSMNLAGLRPSELAYILQNGYETVVRAGLHCAPLIHRAMGTQEYGTVRVSISALTKEQEAWQFLGIMREIAAAAGNSAVC